MKRRFVILTIALTFIGGLAWEASSGGNTTQPTRPSWVKADGTVDLSKIPAKAPKVDANGKVILDPKTGKPKLFSTNSGPPPAPPAGARSSEVQEQIVVDARTRQRVDPVTLKPMFNTDGSPKMGPPQPPPPQPPTPQPPTPLGQGATPP